MAIDFENIIDDSIEFECQIGDSIDIDLSTIVAVKVPLPIALQDKDIEPTTEKQTVTADKEYSGLGTVTVGAVTSDIDENIVARNIRGGVTILGVTGDLEPDKPDQSKVVEPSTSEQVVTADSGFELASVTVKPVTAEIDSDIVAENIRKDIEILGVVGTMDVREDLDTELAGKIIDKTIVEYDDKQGKVQNIGAYAFYQCSDLTYANFPNASYVDNSAFWGCKNLESVNIPNSKFVGGYAFAMCSSLKSIDCPQCTEISSVAFGSCYSLQYIEPSRYVRFVGSNAFGNCRELGSFFARYASAVEASAFYNCSNLTYVDIGGVYSLSSHTFRNCLLLPSVSFYNASLISVSAFANCQNLSAVYLYQNDITALRSSVFNSTPILDSSYLGYYGSVYVPENLVASYQTATNWVSLASRIVGIPQSSLSIIARNQFSNQDITEIPSNFIDTDMVGYYAFFRCPNLQEVSLLNCECVGEAAFAQCSNLSIVNMPKLAVVYVNGFSGCSNLQTVVGDNIRYIRAGAFNNCYKLSSISTRLVSVFESNTFNNCRSLQNVNFENCESISFNAFGSCWSLSEAYMPKCKIIGYSAFSNCSNLSYVYAPNCSLVQGTAFNYCRNLETINIDNVQTFESNAFANCINLSTISLPKCTTIGSLAFQNCYNLLSLYLTGSQVCLISNVNAFLNTPISTNTTSTGGKHGSIFVPASLVDTYKTAPNWSYYADRITAYTET